MLELMRDWLEDEIMTVAPNSRHASATLKPIPLLPPMMRIRVEVSLEVYFLLSDIVKTGYRDGTGELGGF